LFYDIIFRGQDALCKAFANEMKKEFEMSMFGEIKFFVGLQVHQMKYGIYIIESKYVKEILKTFGLEDSKLVSTPMVIGHKLSKNDDSAKVNQTLYRSMIGKLSYIVHSRPDIALSIGIVARLFANPRENHLMVVKRIMRYLKGIEECGLYYKENKKFKLRAYIDAAWARNIDDRKSTSGETFFLGKSLVTWNSKKQNCTSQSTTEAKYLVAAINCTDIVWIKQLLKAMKEEITESMIFYCDNTSAINISKNLVMHTKTKHIAIKYHYLRELVQDKEVKMEYVNTKQKIDGIFTKALPKDCNTLTITKPK
jgi:hypothetical protein